MAGDARYKYRHGIQKLTRTVYSAAGPDRRRVSLTVRSLLPGRREAVKDSEGNEPGGCTVKPEKPA